MLRQLADRVVKIDDARRDSMNDDTADAYTLLCESPAYTRQVTSAVFIADGWERAEKLLRLLRLEWMRRMDDVAIESRIEIAQIDWNEITDAWIAGLAN
jgi:hypothetical protein